ncbi:DUF3846 domain-containing protein [Clostridium sp.]|uniref:DUF3846 domain-containing protein n=1 Tax=Clostridium sp. TaxID=1506 RepID=UPI001B60A462|nr:DUF3846 domain-containing protein [Clostridium sp.]MBP3916619.1 DUF3846 domain-containing protein [Clostridium sp.]
MKEENIRVYEIIPGENKGVEKVIENTLENLQGEVGGLIDCPYISEDLSKEKIDMIINDEGKINGLKPNLVLSSEDKIIDIVFGPVIFASYDDEGNFSSLSENQVKFIKDRIRFDAWKTTSGERMAGLKVIS